MFLASTGKQARKLPNAKEQPVNPFMAQAVKGTDPAGPGVGAPRAELFTEALMRRRRWAAHALGDTPPRDGPFAASAATVAVSMPPKARQEVRSKQTGLNPFAQR
jgi:hypothetical protein